MSYVYVTFSVRLHHISGTVYHLIAIFGPPVQNDDISRCFFIFLEIWFFVLLGGGGGGEGVKGQQIAQN